MCSVAVALLALTGMMVSVDMSMILHSEVIMIVAWSVQFAMMAIYAKVLGPVFAFMVNVVTAMGLVSFFTIEGDEQRAVALFVSGSVMCIMSLWVTFVTLEEMSNEQTSIMRRISDKIPRNIRLARENLPTGIPVRNGSLRDLANRTIKGPKEKAYTMDDTEDMERDIENMNVPDYLPANKVECLKDLNELKAVKSSEEAVSDILKTLKTRSNSDVLKYLDPEYATIPKPSDDAAVVRT